DVIWSVRIQEIQSNIINNLEKLTIWNAGKQGRKFYRSLNDANKRKVMCFCDMDPKKISKGFYTDELSQDKRRIPVIHFTQATPPIIICVKLVKFRVEERMIQPTCYFKNLISCNTLRRITFTGCTKYFEHLAHFFATFGSTIQCLTINIDLIYNVIDGLRLERELLNKMQCLASFDLIIHSIQTHRESIEINTFQTLSWRKFNPIVYWNDIHAHQHTIFTLPYRSNTFKHLSNDFQSTCASNREVFLYFERVRTLSLLVTTPLTLETFEFIAKSFPNIKTLELTNPIELSRFELKHNRTISLLSDVFLSNNTLQLPSIVKFCFLLRSHYDNYQILRRFLHLLPNLVYLQMFIGRSLFHEILKYEHEDNFIRSALNRIETLQMVNFYDGKNILTHEEIHNLFPNAKKLFSGR
ncbi:unnamed protein product, partial [Rotaria magnacalcarata]